MPVNNTKAPAPDQHMDHLATCRTPESIAVMQPYFLPYLGYFQLLHAADRLILYPHLQYVHQSFMSRNRYPLNDTEHPYFGPNIAKKTRKGLISEVKVNDEQPWRDKMLARICNNYRRAPLYRQVEPIISEIVLHPSPFLAEINMHGVLQICRYLGLERKLDLNVDQYLDLEKTLRHEHQNKTDQCDEPDQKHKRVIKLCKHNKVSKFINPIGGKAIYDRQLLAREGVEISFIRSVLPAYPQRHTKTFVPAMSIIDILFNCEKEYVLELLSQYEIE